MDKDEDGFIFDESGTCIGKAPRHIVVIKEICDYYQRLNSLCSMSESRCLVEGQESQCRMKGYYEKKILNYQPKPFSVRYPDWEEWRA